ncbi:MAG: histidine phosphatase family protein [Jatrophihabitantaceae bacterium]
MPDGAELWLIRHGETEWSRSGQHTGRTDLPLLPDGEAQARALRIVLAGVHPALVLCSPRRRAQQTATLAGLSVDAIDQDLAEWDYGDYEGLTSQQIRADVPGWSIWTHGARGGESVEQVSARADRVLQRAAATLAQGPVILVAHGHIGRVLGARWIDLPAAAGANLLLGTAAPSMLGWQYDNPVIAQWNLPNPALNLTETEAER